MSEKYEVELFSSFGSLIKNMPSTPITSVSAPITENITVQLLSLSRSKNIKPPNTTSTATSGIIAFIPSARPRFSLSVESVSHALNAASFAVEPKNVITQSRIIASDTPTVAADVVIAKVFSIKSVFKNTKLKIEMPHRIYPDTINSFRLPILSLSAPINTVVSVAVTADAATISDMSDALALKVL